MSQLTQMTRYVSSWLGWLPVATAAFDSCLLSSSSLSLGRSQDEDAAMPQESSGIYTVVAIYLAMTIFLATVGFCTAKDKAKSDPSRSRDKRKLATQNQHQHQQEQQRPWRYSATGMALIKLIRQLDTPQRSRHQMRLRLRMRLRRHLEEELKLIRELEEKGPQLGLLGDQEEANNSTYFDPSSEAEP